MCHTSRDTELFELMITFQRIRDEQQFATVAIKTNITDTVRYTDELFDSLPGVAVTFPVSRLVVDVERFEDDHFEPMSSRGMGVLYYQTHDQRPLRRPLAEEERRLLLDQFYRPHHRALETAVETALLTQGGAMLIDCHSFPSRALP